MYRTGCKKVNHSNPFNTARASGDSLSAPLGAYRQLLTKYRYLDVYPPNLQIHRTIKTPCLPLLLDHLGQLSISASTAFRAKIVCRATPLECERKLLATMTRIHSPSGSHIYTISCNLGPRGRFIHRLRSQRGKLL